MSKSNLDEDAKLLEKLKSVIEADGNLSLNASEIKIAKRMIKIFIAFEALGELGSFIKTILLWIGAIIGSWLAFKAGIIDWLESVKP